MGMHLSWVLVVLLTTTVTPSTSHSGDGDWGSGQSDLPKAHNESQQPRDAPAGTTHSPQQNPEQNLQQNPEQNPEHCASQHYTCPVSARRLRAMKEELSYLQAIQHGNKAVMENLIQYVSAEMGEQSYQEAILENVAGIKEDHLSCQGVVSKVVQDMESQLEADTLEFMAGAQKIREESDAFERLLRTAADISHRLEVSSQTLQSSFTRRLEKVV